MPCMMVHMRGEGKGSMSVDGAKKKASRSRECPREAEARMPSGKAKLLVYMRAAAHNNSDGGLRGQVDRASQSVKTSLASLLDTAWKMSKTPRALRARLVSSTTEDPFRLVYTCPRNGHESRTREQSSEQASRTLHRSGPGRCSAKSSNSTSS